MLLMTMHLSGIGTRITTNSLDLIAVCIVAPRTQNLVAYTHSLEVRICVWSNFSFSCSKSDGSWFKQAKILPVYILLLT